MTEFYDNGQLVGERLKLVHKLGIYFIPASAQNLRHAGRGTLAADCYPPMPTLIVANGP